MAVRCSLGELAGDGGLDGGGEVAARRASPSMPPARRAAAVFRPENEKSQPSRPNRARGSGNRPGSPPSASRSSAGPAG